MRVDIYRFELQFSVYKGSSEQDALNTPVHENKNVTRQQDKSEL